MRQFIKKGPKYKQVHFEPEKHPYKPHPGFPLRHGLLKSGKVDWDFWCQKETWTFDQAVRLLDDSRTGDDSYTALPWPLYQEISNGLSKVIEAEAGQQIFPETPIIRDYPTYPHPFIDHKALVYPGPFIRWAYHNGYAIPTGLKNLIQKPLALKMENPKAENQPDSQNKEAELFRAKKDAAANPKEKALWEIAALKVEGLQNADVFKLVYPGRFKAGEQEIALTPERQRQERSIQTRKNYKSFISKKMPQIRRLLEKEGLPIPKELQTGQKKTEKTVKQRA